MITIALVIVFGIVFSYFATLNTGAVEINFGSSEVSLPLYGIILLSIGIGVLISFTIHIILTFGSNMRMSSSERSLSDARREIASLTKEVHKLEIENTKLHSRLEEDMDEDSI